MSVRLTESALPLLCLRFRMSGSNTGMGKMHLDLYTNNAALTQKARFWCNFVSSLKGEFDGLGVERERGRGQRCQGQPRISRACATVS